MNKKLVSIALCALAFSSQALSETLNISYVRSPFNLQMMVMKEHGILDKEMAKQNVDVQWHEITSGAKQAQALASGDLHIAGVMNTASVLMANGANNPVRVIAGVSRPTDTFAIVGAKGGPKSVADLKGKKIAGPKGTVLHQTLVAALVKENMTIQDVEFIQMGLPQAFAALQSGQIDAALLAAGFVINAEKDGANVITTATGLVVPKLVMASSETIINQHPNWIEAARKAHDDAAKWIKNNPQEAIELGAKLQQISIEDAKKLYDWAHFTQRLNEEDMKSLALDMQFMLENDMMRQPVDIKKIVQVKALEE
ncbi:ABC transporter substrate-binding protein [Vibrio sp. MACH09]|uniref:ABC transporter substrate-binding protein n=1 Tax=Vibrio sp. MACH09 TaxID=3025122 RepID=UPI00278CF0FF|nr:NrtA/SsuA/CpmA family ABC transporter substrate-binding protein [Vibrio sp. MACH09]GLO62451.1 ABC transporter substrate-binding protein [Vibrio sp. MACH09]